MKNLLVAFLCVIALSSCQKEFSLADGTNNGNNNSGNGNNTPPSGGSDGALLVKAYKINEKNDSVTTAYEYDGQNRIAEFSTKGKDDTITFGLSMKFIRDADGKITQINKETAFGAFKDAAAFAMLGLSPDAPIKSTIVVHYPTGSKDFDTATETVDLGQAGLIIKQKYSYTNGRVSKVEVYQTVSMFGATMQEDMLSMRYEYTYSAEGNISGMKLYAFDPSAPGSPLVLQEIMTFTYSDKKNSTPFSNEYYLWSNEGMNSNNFATGISMNDGTNKPMITIDAQGLLFNSHDLIQSCNVIQKSLDNNSSSYTTKKYKCTFYYK